MGIKNSLKKVKDAYENAKDKAEYLKPDDVTVNLGPVERTWEIEGPKNKARQEGVQEGNQESAQEAKSNFFKGAKRGFFGDS